MCVSSVDRIHSSSSIPDDRFRRTTHPLAAPEGRKALPWLRTRDPFQRLVAEVMLQQTQTGTVAPYWERFVGRWPTAAALAAEDRDVVMKAWEGLGYYRRCRLLCDAAERVVTDFGGVTPSDYASLLTLPGIGTRRPRPWPRRSRVSAAR